MFILLRTLFYAFYMYEKLHLTCGKFLVESFNNTLICNRAAVYAGKAISFPVVESRTSLIRACGGVFSLGLRLFEGGG